MAGRSEADAGKASGRRASIPSATQRALWALSRNTCYVPGCGAPIVVQESPGEFQLNAQITHIYGVKPNSPRHRDDIPDSVRDSFANLLLCCWRHHQAIDKDEERYTPEVLQTWKQAHEGANAQALLQLPIDEDVLAQTLTDAFAEPLDRLGAITDDLERTGAASAETVAELREILDVLMASESRPSFQASTLLAEAAAVFGSPDFARRADNLLDAASLLEDTTAALSDVAERIDVAAKQLRLRGLGP